MARNTRASKGLKKIEPAVQELYVTFTAPAGAFGTNQVTHYIDLSQCASIINRRFYRQGLNWCVNDIKLMNNSTLFGVQPQGSFSISKLPQTWVMSNSWEKSFRAWQKMNNEALQEANSVKPKFLDFKIYADAEHHDAGFSANLMPFNGGGLATPGEWKPSTIHVPIGVGFAAQTNEFEMIAVGPSYPGASTATGLDSVSLIEGYAASRALPDIADPNTPLDALDATGSTPENWMSALFSAGTEQTDEVLTDLVSDNNIAPYPFENDGVHVDTMYPNGANQLPSLQIHDLVNITGTTIGAESHLSGGMFPCGLMKIVAENYDDENGLNFLLRIRLVPGNHRGYLCDPMTEM